MTVNVNESDNAEDVVVSGLFAVMVQLPTPAAVSVVPEIEQIREFDVEYVTPPLTSPPLVLKVPVCPKTKADGVAEPPSSAVNGAAVLTAWSLKS